MAVERVELSEMLDNSSEVLDRLSDVLTKPLDVLLHLRDVLTKPKDVLTKPKDVLINPRDMLIKSKIGDGWIKNLSEIREPHAQTLLRAADQALYQVKSAHHATTGAPARKRSA